MQKNTAFATWNSYVHKIPKQKILFLMKVSIINFVIMLIALQLFASGRINGQNINDTQINFGVSKKSLKETLKMLGKESGYTLFYPSEKIDQQKTDLNVPFQTRSVASTLSLVLANSGLSYRQQGDKTIILFSSDKVETHVSPPTLISGKVTDNSGHELAGVVIKFKGNPKAAVFTNLKGEFNFFITNTDDYLVFSYVGYKTREVRIKDLKNPVSIVMEDVTGSLDEVQVTAYGTTTRRLNTGDQTTITAKEIEKYPSNNALVALQGSVPGLLITQNTGTPGSTYKVNIRGLNSISAGSDPFYVIDGIPYSGGSFSSQRGNTLSPNGAQAYDALSLINPLDIESINVLKDADATAIYGSRAANGVILITTKKGKAGAPRVDVNVFSGVRQMSKKLKLLNTEQYLDMRREAKRNDNAAILPTDYDLNGTWDQSKYTDFSDLFLGGNAYNSNAQVGISGGSTDLQYLVSANYRNITNLQKFAGGADQTSSLHFNLNSGNPSNRFSFTFGGGFSYNNNTMPPSDLIGSITSLAPNSPSLFNPNGTLNYENNTFDNPLRTTNQLANTSAYNLTSNLVLGYKVASGLTLQTTLGYNKQILDEFLATPTTAISPTSLANGSKPFSNFTHDNKMYWSIEPSASYTKEISSGVLTSTLGWSLQKQSSDTQLLQATGYSSDLLLGNIAGGTSITPFGSGVGISVYKYNAAFGRINYNWKEKYILNLSGRYDGSSRFGENRRFHFFPAAGAAWLFSSEDLFKNNFQFISFGKLRASYGVTGNDQISNYNYLTNYSLLLGTPYQGVPGVAPSNLPNPNLSWETVAKSNVGLELKFLKNRIGIEGNYYLNRSSDIISGNALASTTGFASINQNQQSKIVNKGFDLTVTTQNIQNDEFVWTSAILFTRQRNKLEAYPGLTPAQQLTLGQAVNSQKVYRYAGVNTQTGLYQFYDANGNITSSPSQTDDLVKVVDTNPNYFGSVSNTFTYKGFSLSFMFRYVKQVGASVRGILASSIFPGYPQTNIPTEMLDRWQKPGDNATYQKYSANFTAIIQQLQINRFSDVYYGDASYIRLQNASLAYQFPVKITRNIHLKNLRVYVNGENLATISHYGILDPENQSLQRVGPLRSIVFGLQTSF